MRPAHATSALGFCTALALAGVMVDAQAADKENSIQIGYGHIGFNTKSGDLTGPPGTTPPGVKADLKDTGTLAVVYERHIYGPWSLVLQGGTPPLVKLMGAGTAAPLGQVGTVRAWFPGLRGQYTFNGPWGTRPYLAAGVNYTTYSDEQVGSNFTAAFGGTDSTASLKNSWGYIAKVGVSVPVTQNWFVDASYSKYEIRTTATVTTATPGFGNITRTVDVKADPGIFGLTVGYRF